MKYLRRISLYCCAIIVLLNSCKKDESIPYELEIPDWFPEMQIPSDNQLTSNRVELGRKLFFDPLLSLDTTVSCGTCHQQDKAFTDGLSISLGVEGAFGMRNSPTLANIGYAPYFFHDGGVETLELQSQAPIFSDDEMRFSIAGFLERISDDDEYQLLFENAYSREPDAFGITRAIASFERTLISGNSRYDQYEFQKDGDALSEQELRGKQLFFSTETKCSTCHPSPLFTNYEFENIGLYQSYLDSGRARISHLAADNGKFKVPTLRNIELTAPYMHDGSVETLEQVIDHFDGGGVGNINQSELIVPLNLTAQEKDDLVAFLKTLTDLEFVNDPAFAE